MKIINRLVAGSLMAATLLGLTSAQAFNGKVYPGGGCTQLGGGIYTRYLGSVENASAANELTVFCPFIRDEISISSATAKVFNRNQTIPLTCTIFSEAASGSTFSSFSNTQHTTAFGSNFQTLTFSGLPANDYYYANCSIPREDTSGFSHVVSFDIHE